MPATKVVDKWLVHNVVDPVMKNYRRAEGAVPTFSKLNFKGLLWDAASVSSVICANTKTAGICTYIPTVC